MKQLIFASVFFLVMACSKNEAILSPSDKYIVSKEVFASYLSTRESNTDHYFELTDIKRAGEELEITILGQCEPSYYQVVWDGSVLLSYPAQVNLLVTFEISGDILCDTALKEHKIKVNLRELLGEKYDDTPYLIHVLNGSKIQDKTSDPEGNVSDKN